jgi:adenylosuccinate synthase
VPAKTGIYDIEKFDDFPVNAQSFVREIETALKIPVSYISVNNEEDDGVIRIIR